MITQAIMDLIRDTIVNWISGTNSLLVNIDGPGAGAAIGAGANQAGHFLALWLNPGMWTATTLAWGAWMVTWLVTGAIAIIARRFTSS